MTDPAFASRYRDGLHRFVEDPSERRLSTAYELGRAAVQAGLSVLDVAGAHAQALPPIVETSAAGGVGDALAAAGDFLVESLAAFEMVQRGVTDARRAAFEERRRARMLRELSSVLADAGIAASAPESAGELAQLVAEIAREATGAAEARIELETTWGFGAVAATAEEQELDTWSELLQPPSHRPQVREPGDPAEVVREPLSALDGRPIGTLEVAAAGGRRFRHDDRATVAQIAQMTAAWLERAQPQRR